MDTTKQGAKRFFRLPRVLDPKLETLVDITVSNLQAEYAAKVAYYMHLYNTADNESNREAIRMTIEEIEDGLD